MSWSDLAHSGVVMPQAAHYLLHISVGAFFAASGYNKLTNPARHEALLKTLKADHVPCLRFNSWWVPGWELVAGVSLVVGLFPALAATVLFTIMLVACVCEAPGRVRDYAPINRADTVADYLYLPEVLYGVVLGAIILGV